METKWRRNGEKKISMTLTKAHQRNISYAMVFMQFCIQCAQKADGLSEYVVPLHFQKYFLYYDTTQAGETSTVCLVAKWTFFRILLVWTGITTGLVQWYGGGSCSHRTCI